MTKDEAIALLAAIGAMREANNEVARRIEGLADGQEKRQLRRAISTIMADAAVELERPILQTFPDLDRDMK